MTAHELNEQEARQMGETEDLARQEDGLVVWSYAGGVAEAVAGDGTVVLVQAAVDLDGTRRWIASDEDGITVRLQPARLGTKAEAQEVARDAADEITREVA